MYPETITSLSPIYFPKGKFFLIPLKENDKPITIRLSDRKYKIHEHMNGKEKSFSIGIDLLNEYLDEESLDWIKNLETKIQDLAMENLPKIQDLAKEKLPKLQSKFNFKKDDFHIIKKDRSGKSKIYAKVPFKNNKIIPTFWEASKWGKNKPKKMRVDPSVVVGEDLGGDVIVEIKQSFVSDKFKSITCVVKEALFWEREEPETFFDEFEESISDEDED